MLKAVTQLCSHCNFSAWIAASHWNVTVHTNIHSKVETDADICQRTVHWSRACREQTVWQLAGLDLLVPGAVKKAAGNVMSCSSALWVLEFALGLWCSSVQLPPVILSKASRWKQMDACSLVSAIWEDTKKCLFCNYEAFDTWSKCQSILFKRACKIKYEIKLFLSSFLSSLLNIYLIHAAICLPSWNGHH